VLFLLGQLCRHGADLLDEAAAAGAAGGGAAPAPPSSAQCMALFARVWRARRLGPKALDTALQVGGGVGDEPAWLGRGPHGRPHHCPLARSCV
jgi:hypothetical protein